MGKLEFKKLRIAEGVCTTCACTHAHT